MTLKVGKFCTFSFILKQNPNLNGIFLSTSGIHHEWDTYLLLLARFSTICDVSAIIWSHCCAKLGLELGQNIKKKAKNMCQSRMEKEMRGFVTFCRLLQEHRRGD